MGKRQQLKTRIRRFTLIAGLLFIVAAVPSPAVQDRFRDYNFFAGVRITSSESNIKDKLGLPDKTEVRGQLRWLTYQDGELMFGFRSRTGVAAIIYEPAAAYRPEYIGEADHSKSFVGQDVKTLKRSLGKPDDEISGTYIYRFRSGNRVVTLMFFCYSFRDDVCSEFRLYIN